MDDVRKAKPWEELSEEERQKIRESWKVKLPDEFDVFCLYNLEFDSKEDFHVPGNVYVGGNFFLFQKSTSCNTIIDGDFIVDGSVYAFDINVSGDFIVSDSIFAGCTKVNGNLISGGLIESLGGIHVSGDLYVSNCIFMVKSYIRSDEISVLGDFTIDGNLNCYDVFIYNNFTFNGRRINCANMRVYGSFTINGSTDLNSNGYPICIGFHPTSKSDNE